MGRFWVLRLCVTLVILACCPMFVLTVTATSSDPSRDDPSSGPTVANWLAGEDLILVAQRRPKKNEADNCGDNGGTTNNCSGDNGGDNQTDGGDNGRSSGRGGNGNDNDASSFVLPP